MNLINLSILLLVLILGTMCQIAWAQLDFSLNKNPFSESDYWLPQARSIDLCRAKISEQTEAVLSKIGKFPKPVCI